MKPIVFLGPSLTRDEATWLLDAAYRPPIRQGDLMRAVAARPPAIAIIDGVFTHVPTVRHREILWALSRGIPVFGAASMGALRAAELPDMLGHGLIYRWYRRHALLPDDAVAVAHAPPELGARPLSMALVDLRRTLSAARRAGVLTPERHEVLVRAATALPFARRTLDALPLTPVEAQRLPQFRRSQKSEDARGLLRRLARHQSTGIWPQPRVKNPAITHAWLDDLASSGFDTGAALQDG